MVGPRTKRMSKRLANPKYSNPPDEEEDEDSGDVARRPQPPTREPVRKAQPKKKPKEQPAPPLPRNELDAPEDGFWDPSGQWHDGPRPTSAASSRGGHHHVNPAPENPPILSPDKPGGEERSSSVGPETPHHPLPRHPSSQPDSSNIRRKPAGQEALFLPASPSPAPSDSRPLPLLDYLNLSSPPTQKPFKRQSGRQGDRSEGEPSGDEDMDPPPRRRIRTSTSMSELSQGSSRVVLGDLPLEDYQDEPASSRHKTYSRRVRYTHRRQREEPAFSPGPRRSVPSFEELMEYQLSQERPRSYPSSILSSHSSRRPDRVPSTYDDEYDDDEAWSAVLPRPGGSARRRWSDIQEEDEEDLSRAHGMSPSWYRRRDHRDDVPITRAFLTSQFHIPPFRYYPPEGKLEFGPGPYCGPPLGTVFEDEECGQIDYTQTTNYYKSRGTATNHKKVSSATRRRRHITGKVHHPVTFMGAKPLRTVPREDFIEELRLRHEGGTHYSYPVDERLQRFTRRPPRPPTAAHNRRATLPRFADGAPSEPVSEFTASNPPPSQTIRLRPLPQGRMGGASNTGAPSRLAPLKFARDDSVARPLQGGTANQSWTPLESARKNSATSQPQEHPPLPPSNSSRNPARSGGRGSGSGGPPPIHPDDLPVLQEWQDLEPDQPHPDDEDDYGYASDARNYPGADDDVEQFEPESPSEVVIPNRALEPHHQEDLDVESIIDMQEYLNDNRSRPPRANREPLADLTPRPPGSLSGLGMTDLLLNLATKTVEQDDSHLPPLPLSRQRKLDERKQRLAEKHNSSSSRPRVSAVVGNEVIIPATLEPLQVYRPKATERPIVVASTAGPSTSVLPRNTEPSHLQSRRQRLAPPQPENYQQAIVPATVTPQVPDSIIEAPSSQRRPMRSRFTKDPQPPEKYIPLLPVARNPADRPPPVATSGSTQHATQPVTSAQPRSRSRTTGPLSAPFKQPTNTNAPLPPPLTAAQRMKARLAASFPSYDEILPKPPPPPPPPALGARARAKTEHRASTEAGSSTSHRRFKAPTGAE